MFCTASFHPLLRLVRGLFLTVGLLIFLTRAAVVQGAPTESLSSAATAASTLEKYLTPNGTLALPDGFSGSLDARGWALASGANESPRFVPARPGTTGLALDSAESSPPRLPGDERWEAGFQPRGVGWALALAAGAGSDLYVGGYFRAAGNTVANSIAQWDGSQWSALGYGLNGSVNALAWDNTRGILYAGGQFDAICTTADCSTHTPAPRVAQWNGTAWSPLVSNSHRGVDDTVNALAVDPQHNLYVGGEFTGLCTDDSCTGTAPAHRIAKWTPNASSGTWSTLSSGMNNLVFALAWWNSIAGGRLVVGGAFTTAGGLDVNRLAMWDGTTWSSFYSGVNGVVLALAVDPVTGAVVVGGNFDHICATDAFPPTCNTSSATQVNHVAVTTWLLDYWGPLGWGVNYAVYAFAIDSTAKKVYAGGSFYGLCSDQACTPAAVAPAIHLAVVDYNTLPYTWSALGSGMDEPVRSLALQPNSLYAGGSFQVAGGVTASGIARWALSSGPWSALNAGDGLSGPAWSVAADSAGNVYVGGDYSTAGGLVVNNIARWNIQTRTWSALGFGVDDAVNALAVDSAGTLFAGGYFHYVCSNPYCAHGSRVNHLARWSAAQGWTGLDNGVSAGVYALAFAPDGNLYVGGSPELERCPDPDCTNLTTAHGLLRWTRNTNSLGSFGVGASDTTLALAVDRMGTLYIGGRFHTLCTGACLGADIRTFNHIARWTSGVLSAVGSGVDENVQALAVDANDRLYVGGDFRYACAASSPCGQATSLNRIGRWNPSGAAGSWSAFQNGLSDTVYALTLDSTGHLFATGSFRGTCPDPACATPETGVNHIAQWDGTAWSALGSGLDVRSDGGRGLAWHAGTLSVGGYFDTAGGKPARGFARYVDVQPPLALYLPLVVK